MVSYQGRAAALDVNSGRLLWQREASSYVGVAEGFGNIYVSQASGSVEGLDSRGASSLWNNDAWRVANCRLRRCSPATWWSATWKATCTC